MPQNSTDVVGRKSGKLLQGLLMGLYGISGVEANPEFLPAGTEGPIGQGGNLPFKGSGPFGGLKAKGANAEFAGQNALADAATARNISMLPKKLAIENSAALDLYDSQAQRAKESALQAKGVQSQALGTGLAQLPLDQLQAMGVPATFSNPSEQVDWYNQAYGANTPLVKAPGIAAEERNRFGVESNPLTLANRVQQEVNKGNIQIGSSVFNPSAPEGQQYIRGDSYQPFQETVEVPTGEMTIGPDGQLTPKMGVKVINRQEFKPGGMGNITDLRVSDEEVEAARNINSPDLAPPEGRQFSQEPTTPPTTTTLTTKPAESQPKSIGVLPDLVENNFGFNLPANWYQQTFAKPVADAASLLAPNKMTQAGPALNQAKTNAGNILGDARKLLIRQPTEQFSGVPVMDSIRSGLHGVGDATYDVLDSGIAPVREILEGIAANMQENDRIYTGRPDLSAKPLPIPPNRLQKYLQNRAINAGRNPNLQSR